MKSKPKSRYVSTSTAGDIPIIWGRSPGLRLKIRELFRQTRTGHSSLASAIKATAGHMGVSVGYVRKILKEFGYTPKNFHNH